MKQGRDPSDTRTLDLLEWQPPDIVARFDDVHVRAASLRVRIAKAVAATLNDSDLGRGDIAKRMSDFLGEKISKNMLDAYAAESREDHSIPFLRLLALIEATGDIRALQLAAELFGHAVIDTRYLTWVEVGQLADKKQDLDRAFDSARRQARRGTRR